MKRYDTNTCDLFQHIFGQQNLIKINNRKTWNLSQQKQYFPYENKNIRNLRVRFCGRATVDNSYTIKWVVVFDTTYDHINPLERSLLGVIMTKFEVICTTMHSRQIYVRSRSGNFSAKSERLASLSRWPN